MVVLIAVEVMAATSDIAIIRSCSRVIELGVVLVTVSVCNSVCGGVVRHSNHQKL